MPTRHNLHHTLPLAITAAIALLPLAATNTSGPDWDGDNYEDAGDKPSTAQKVSVEFTQTILTVRGSLKGEDEEGLAGTGTGDYQDMYEVVLKEPGQFSIQTLPPLGGAEFDTILSVYAPNGTPLLANNDADQGTTGSIVGSQSSDGTFSITNPGVVYIAISGYPSRPLNSAGEDVFAWTQDPTAVVGPSNAAGPVAGWSEPGEIGAYVIQLTSVGPIPPNCGAENTSSCFEVHPLPFCSTPGCCEAVCSVDPFCCGVTWDAFCVDEANLFCGGEGLLHCGSKESGPCLEPHVSPYCNDPACCAQVCSYIPECCDTSWDEMCATFAQKTCASPCNQNCPPDLDFDLFVTGGDLAILLGNWGNPGCTDLNGDGATNGADIAILLGFWGDGCFD